MPSPILDQSDEGQKSASHSSDFKLRTNGIQVAEVLIFVYATLLGGALFYLLKYYDQLTTDTSLALSKEDFYLSLPLWLLYIIVPVCYALTWRISSVSIDKSTQKSSTESNLSAILMFTLFMMTLLNLVIGLVHTVHCINDMESFELTVAVNAILAFSLHGFYLYKTIKQDYNMKILLDKESSISTEASHKTGTKPASNQRFEP